MNSALAKTANQQLWDEISRFGPEGDFCAPKTSKGIGSKEELNESMYAKITTDKTMLKDLLSYGRRNRFVGNFAWAVPSPEAIAAIKTFAHNDTILEINAGSGLWARFLHEEGAKIIATDIRPEEYSRRHFNVHKMNHAKAIEKYGDECNVLMTVWPNYQENYAAEALKSFRGSRLVYIGEYEGCTADDEFHDILSKEWHEGVVIKIPKWIGLHDCLFMYTRA